MTVSILKSMESLLDVLSISLPRESSALRKCLLSMAVVAAPGMVVTQTYALVSFQFVYNATFDEILALLSSAYKVRFIS
jgi:hypothetical protein